MLPSKDGTQSYEYAVTEKRLTALKTLIQPIYNKLITLPGKTVAYDDDNGYPNELTQEFYDMEFNPADSQSSFAGQKLIRLYERMDALLEILDHMKYSDEENKNEIIFYDSY